MFLMSVNIFMLCHCGAHATDRKSRSNIKATQIYTNCNLVLHLKLLVKIKHTTHCDQAHKYIYIFFKNKQQGRKGFSHILQKAGHIPHLFFPAFFFLPNVKEQNTTYNTI